MDDVGWDELCQVDSSELGPNWVYFNSLTLFRILESCIPAPFFFHNRIGKLSHLRLGQALNMCVLAVDLTSVGSGGGGGDETGTGP